MQSPLFRLSFPSIHNPEYRLRAGCYYIRYTPNVLEDDVLYYEGTLRVQHLDADKRPLAIRESDEDPAAGKPDKDAVYILASGDLYAHRKDSLGDDESRPPSGIPIFPRRDYRYYLCLKDIPEWSVSPTGFSLVLESHAFLRPSQEWNYEGTFQADMKWILPPPGYPFDYLEGQVFEGPDKPNGHLIMAWVSNYFRRAIVQIDTQPGVEAPLGEGDDHSWRQVFKEVGWDLEHVSLQNFLAVPQSATWTQAELTEQLPRLCKSHDLDTVWRYYLLCVSEVERVDRGFTYYYVPTDDPGHDFREVAVAESNYRFRKGDWGKVDGTLQENKLLYFRVAVHEIGHAMSLEHHTADGGFMNTTPQLARDFGETFSQKKPKYSFWLGDQQRLRHWPDIVVRPGTLIDSRTLPSNTVPVFPENGTDEPDKTQTLVTDAQCMDFRIFPLPKWGHVPLGAPVRINLQLTNVNKEARSVPPKMSPKSGYVTVTVIGPDKTVRGFSAVGNHMDAAALEQLRPSQTKTGSLTLLADDVGDPLFPTPGEYEIEVQLLWRPGRREVQTKAKTSILITPAVNPKHAEAARAVLETPESLLVLAVGKDSSPKGLDALRLALESDILLRHFVFTKFRLLTQPSGKQKGDLNAAWEFLKLYQVEAVLGEDEIKEFKEMVSKAKKSP